jgi:hypothetical protein
VKGRIGFSHKKAQKVTKIEPAMGRRERNLEAEKLIC